MFLHVYFFMSVHFFHVSVPCLAFFTERVLRSLTPYGKTLLFVMLTFFKDWYHVYHFHGQNISFYYIKGRKFKGPSVYFFTPVYLFHQLKKFHYVKSVL